jgi:[CysO sulfur-carrier protein]-S-L-cysteine hydrolase
MSGEPSIPRDILLKIYAQARAEFPKECCGYLFGSGARTELVQCRNRQDQLHALDPQTHTRTAENAYNIGGKELLDLARSFDSDRPVTVIYHSHPRVGAYFSEEDTRAALGTGFPVDYLVVDAQETSIVEAKLFRRDGDVYVEIERFEGADL